MEGIDTGFCRTGPSCDNMPSGLVGVILGDRACALENSEAVELEEVRIASGRRDHMIEPQNDRAVGDVRRTPPEYTATCTSILVSFSHDHLNDLNVKRKGNNIDTRSLQHAIPMRFSITVSQAI